MHNGNGNGNWNNEMMDGGGWWWMTIVMVCFGVDSSDLPLRSFGDQTTRPNRRHRGHKRSSPSAWHEERLKPTSTAVALTR